MTTKTAKKPAATHIRFTERIEAMLHEASERTGLPKSEIVRITTGIGLRYLAAIDYDIDGAIFEKAQKVTQAKRSESPANPHPQNKRNAG